MILRTANTRRAHSNRRTLRMLAVSVALAVPALEARSEEIIRLETVEVYGSGELRQVQNLPIEDYRHSAPGTSPLKALNKLAGVNFQAADAYGAYEWGVRLSVRGFSQSQMGFTLDDVPLGDMFYSSLNGLTISRALIGENLARARISQGAGSLDTAATSALGGAIQFYSLDPGDVRGATGAQTLGSNATTRTFARFDSGRLTGNGKFYVSAARQQQDLWKGSGEQGYEQLNAKYVQPLGDSLLSAYFDYSERREMDYQDMTREWIDKLGYQWNNYWPSLAASLANASATGDCCGVPALGKQSVNDPLDAAYYFASGVRRDHFGYVSLDAALNDHAAWKTTLYGQRFRGVSTWATPYKATPGADGSVLSERVLDYDTRRYGVLSDLTWELGKHTLNGGIWLENNSAAQARLFYPIYTSGPLWSPYKIPDQSSAFLTQWAYQFDTDTAKLHLQDTWRFDEKLTLRGGFKSLYSRTNGTPTVNNLGKELAQGALTASDAFLPQIGANWKITANDELFFDVSKTLRTYQQGGYGLGLSPWAVGNQAAFQAIQGQLKPETAWTYEAGYRFKRKLENGPLRGFDGLLTAYHVNFRDRLLNISPGGSLIAATAGAAILANVGGVTTDGVEASATLHLTDRWSWYNALSYNRSTYDADYLDGERIIATAGRTVVDTPQFLFKSDLTYRSSDFYARLNADYVSTRYVTYTNDQAAPPRWLFNLSAGQSFGKRGPLADLSVQFDIYNLFDREYISTMGTGGFTAGGDNQTLQVGAPRQWFLTLKARL